MTGTAANPFSYFAYDFLTGRFLGQLPLRGVQFGQQLDMAGSGQATLDLRDPRIQTTSPIACTIPNRTFIVVDYLGAIVWSGIVTARRWSVDSSGGDTKGELALSLTELWSYFGLRIQATDYSAPPTSGIGPMSLWTADVWDANLIACQIVSDALGVASGNPLNGTGLLLNGATPSAATPAAPAGDYVSVTYPFTSTQTVDTIVAQLSQLGLGVGFDFGVDVAYSAGAASAPIATINLSYPRRGRTFAQNNLIVDITTARSYEFAEDGSQTANQVYEIGGSGAIEVSQNVNPISQGYPLLERVFSRANAQSANILALLAQTGLSDLATFSYAPVAPTITLSLFDPNLPIGSFTVGDDFQLQMPALAGDGKTYDPRFPAGLNQEWRIVGWNATVADAGDSTMQLTLNQPPFLSALAPAV